MGLTSSKARSMGRPITDTSVFRAASKSIDAARPVDGDRPPPGELPKVPISEVGEDIEDKLLLLLCPCPCPLPLSLPAPPPGCPPPLPKNVPSVCTAAARAATCGEPS